MPWSSLGKPQKFVSTDIAAEIKALQNDRIVALDNGSGNRMIGTLDQAANCRRTPTCG